MRDEKDDILADALRTAIEYHYKTVKLKRLLIASGAVIVALFIGLIVNG